MLKKIKQIKEKFEYQNQSIRNLFNEETGVLDRREWRGYKDTAYDYYSWLRNWKDLVVFVGNKPDVKVKSIFRYRWMTSYLATPAFIDKAVAGMRGTELRISHLHYNMVVRGLIDVLNISFLEDKKVVLMDELVPPQILGGFPNLIPLPAQLAPIFISSMVDQHLPPVYIDAMEYYGVASDVCPLPQSESGVAIEDDYPKIGCCMITTNMPCDGSIMTSSYQDRRFNLPTFPLTIPLRYDEDWAEDYTVAELKDCIAFIEEHTGETFDWDAFQEVCETYNQQTEYELEKWEYNKTDYPQVTGSTLWLYRLYYFQAAAGIDKRFLEVDKKVNELMKKAYENKERDDDKQRYRAVIWSCPSNYYTDLPVWLRNCWGITTVMDMETATSTSLIDTSTKDSMLAGVGTAYQGATMRKHTKGGYAHVLDELWNVVDEFGVDLVLMYDQISCKGMDGLKAMFDEQAREKGVKLMWVEQDLMDFRTISRQQMRDQVNNFMFNVMKAEPNDERLLEFDDNLSW